MRVLVTNDDGVKSEGPARPHRAPRGGRASTCSSSRRTRTAAGPAPRSASCTPISTSTPNRCELPGCAGIERVRDRRAARHVRDRGAASVRSATRPTSWCRASTRGSTRAGRSCTRARSAPRSPRRTSAVRDSPSAPSVGDALVLGHGGALRGRGVPASARSTRADRAQPQRARAPLRRGRRGAVGAARRVRRGACRGRRDARRGCQFELRIGRTSRRRPTPTPASSRPASRRSPRSSASPRRGRPSSTTTSSLLEGVVPGAPVETRTPDTRRLAPPLVAPAAPAGRRLGLRVGPAPLPRASRRPAVGPSGVVR